MMKAKHWRFWHPFKACAGFPLREIAEKLLSEELRLERCQLGPTYAGSMQKTGNFRGGGEKADNCQHVGPTSYTLMQDNGVLAGRRQRNLHAAYQCPASVGSVRIGSGVLAGQRQRMHTA
eukprot:1158978-Pelagomonas_calceolata.AAC.2